MAVYHRHHHHYYYSESLRVTCRLSANNLTTVHSRRTSESRVQVGRLAGGRQEATIVSLKGVYLLAIRVGYD